MPQGTGTKPPSWAGWQGVGGCRQTPAGSGGPICLALSLSVQPQKRGAPGRQTRKQGRGTRVMQKDGQALRRTEPRMTHVFAEERPLELGFEGQEVARKQESQLEERKCQGKSQERGEPVWGLLGALRRTGSWEGQSCRRPSVPGSRCGLI